jgi:Icc-related predicted phosphoesterase
MRASTGTSGAVFSPAVRILFVGDTHGDSEWWYRSVQVYAETCDAEVIVQVGDFGWWPNSPFVEVVRATEIPVLFLDGNHEHHHDLARAVNESRWEHDLADNVPVPLGGNLAWVPRGAHLNLGGVSLAFLGGAVSIDRGLRLAGHNWFPEEEVTEADLERLGAGGHADLLIAHDAPGDYKVPGATAEKAMGGMWLSQLPACEAHRFKISAAIAAVTPSVVIHGHYHSRYTCTVRYPHGIVRVEGLNQGWTGSEAYLAVDLDQGTLRVAGQQLVSQ